jgi:hypothetical protein
VFFGVTYSKEGISPDPKKMTALKDMSPPINVADLAPGMPLITLRITSWKISEAEDIPKLRRLYRNKPECVEWN